SRRSSGDYAMNDRTGSLTSLAVRPSRGSKAATTSFNDDFSVSMSAALHPAKSATAERERRKGPEGGGIHGSTCFFFWFRDRDRLVLCCVRPRRIHPWGAGYLQGT